MPVFGGWLRNVRDEQMSTDWSYVRALAVESEQAGFDLSLLAELNLNDIKGHAAPALDAWTLAPAVAAVTERLELMLAARPNYHSPSLTAKAISTLDLIAPGPGQPQRRQLVVEGRGGAVRRAVRRPRRPLRAHRRVARGPAPAAHRARGDPPRRAVRPRGLRHGAQAERPADGLHGRRVAQGQGGHQPARHGVRHARRPARGDRREGARHDRPRRRARQDLLVRRQRLRHRPRHRGAGAGRAGADPRRAGRPRGVRQLPGLRRRLAAGVAGLAGGVLRVQPRPAGRPGRHARAGHAPGSARTRTPGST